MKKNTLLNSELSYEISKLGHTQTIVVADCGLPIPENVKRIDLALIRGIPSFKDVLEAILSEMCVEEYTVASEMEDENPKTLAFVREALAGVEAGEVSHTKFKELTRKASCVIRTGEASPYANIILQSGVKF